MTFYEHLKRELEGKGYGVSHLGGRGDNEMERFKIMTQFLTKITIRAKDEEYIFEKIGDIWKFGDAKFTTEEMFGIVRDALRLGFKVSFGR